MDCIIWDIDGCLVDVPDPSARFDWNEFEIVSAIIKARDPIPAMVRLYRTLQQHWGKTTIFFLVTGRPTPYGMLTMEWLQQQHIPYDHIIFRPLDFEGHDADFKREALKTIRMSHNVLFAVEDRAACVKMFREEGVLTLQCADGNY